MRLPFLAEWQPFFFAAAPLHMRMPNRHARL